MKLSKCIHRLTFLLYFKILKGFFFKLIVKTFSIWNKPMTENNKISMNNMIPFSVFFNCTDSNELVWLNFFLSFFTQNLTKIWVIFYRNIFSFVRLSENLYFFFFTFWQPPRIAEEKIKQWVKSTLIQWFW